MGLLYLYLYLITLYSYVTSKFVPRATSGTRATVLFSAVLQVNQPVFPLFHSDPS